MHIYGQDQCFCLIINNNFISTTTMASTQREIAQLMADVTPWYKDPGRRKLYALLLIALLSSATNGYDGYVYCHNFH